MGLLTLPKSHRRLEQPTFADNPTTTKVQKSLLREGSACHQFLRRQRCCHSFVDDRPDRPDAPSALRAAAQTAVDLGHTRRNV